jgi:hypothetical protein
MATLGRFLAMAAMAGLAFSGCGKLVGLDIPVTPLARIQVQVTGDLPSTARPSPQLRVALVWGEQWLPEPFCVLPAESPKAAEVKAWGCPDNFRFVPNRAGADIAIQPDVTGTIDLINLPAADVMVGDITARIAYASLIVYDDINGNGMLDLRHPPHHQRHEEDYNPDTRDIVYGASFISMTKPDQRVAYHEGGDFSAAFYPRPGCPPAPPSFSILSAGGFPRPDLSQTDVLLALSQGQLSSKEASCGVATLDETVVTIRLSAPPADAGTEGDAGAQDDAGTQDDAGAQGEDDLSLAELACTDPETSGTTFYQQPPDTKPDLNKETWACVGFPHLPGDTTGVTSGQQFVTAIASPCQSVAHIILRGCDNDPNCSAPSWDLAPPSWWPCSTTP